MKPSKGKRSFTVIAIVAFVAALSAGCAETKSPAAPPAAPKAAEPKDLKGLLINPHTDTTGDEVVDVDFKQVAEGHLLAPPPGMAFAPDSCVNYVLLGDAAHTPLQTATPEQIKALNGWMQFNKASPVGKDHNLGHDNFFAHFVVEIPGLDLDKIKQGALACKAGTITLDGKVNGTLVNAEVQAQTLAGAKVFSMTQRLAFDPPKDAAGAEALKKYYGTVDANGGVVRLKHVSIVVIGNVFYLGIVPEAPLAETLTKNFYQKASDRGLRA
jgi:hypothetical protein